jgi:hypothetical protein
MVIESGSMSSISVRRARTAASLASPIRSTASMVLW